MTNEEFVKKQGEIISLEREISKSIILGEKPVLTWLKRNFSFIKYYLYYFTHFYIKFFVLKQIYSSSPDYFIHRMFYKLKNNRYFIRPFVWLLICNALPSVIRKGSSYFSTMNNNKKTTTRTRRRKIMNFLIQQHKFETILVLYKTMRITTKLLISKSKEYTENFQKRNEPVK